MKNIVLIIETLTEDEKLENKLVSTNLFAIPLQFKYI